MMSAELKALQQALREEAARYMAAHPEEFAGHPDDEGQCRECSGARTILICPRGHRSGCDCAEIEVPCHACR
jgi:hypothetical protein